MSHSPQPPTHWHPLFNSRPFFLVAGFLLLSAILSATPRVLLSSKSGPPTSKILVSGSGFGPNEGVDIYFDTTDKALVVTNSQGEFKNAEIHAPRTATPGKYWVTALQRNNNKGAQQPFWVNTNWSQSNFEADGTRWNPYENLLNVNNVRGLNSKWIYAVGGAIACTPEIFDGVLYCSDGYIYAINARTGALLWTKTTTGYTSLDVAVSDGVVYFGSSDDNVYALNAHTGAVLWQYKTGGWAGTPIVADGVVYVGSNDNYLYALNGRTGALIWRYQTGGLVGTTPAVVNGMVYFGSDDDNVYAVQASNGELVWKYLTDNFVWGLVVSGNVVYATSQGGIVYAIQATYGGTRWTFTTGALIQSTPAVANDVVYIGSDDNNLYALDARTGREVWAKFIGLPNSPAVANGVLYVSSTYATMYALDPRTGNELWSFPTGDVIYSDSTVANGIVYFSSFDGNVYACSLGYGSEETESASQRPELNALHPNLALKESVRP